MATLTVIVPSAGRPTLDRTIQSIVPQLATDDELVVTVAGNGTSGAKEIDRAQQAARGDLIVYCDDDDAFLPGELDAVRKWVAVNPAAIGVFRRRLPEHAMPRPDRMFLCIPNRPGLLPTWEGSPTHALIPQQAARLQGVGIMFVEPPRTLRQRLRSRIQRRLLRALLND